MMSIPGVVAQVPLYMRSKLSSPVVVGQPKSKVPRQRRDLVASSAGPACDPAGDAEIAQLQWAVLGGDVPLKVSNAQVSLYRYCSTRTGTDR